MHYFDHVWAFQEAHLLQPRLFYAALFGATKLKDPYTKDNLDKLVTYPHNASAEYDAPQLTSNFVFQESSIQKSGSKDIAL